MEAKAVLKRSQYSPRKMRLLADLIRGMRADKALYVLHVHGKQMYSTQLEKLLLSAVNNWKQAHGNSGADESDLIVKSVMVDSGRMLKRILPAPQGRAHRIRKRSNHITIVVGTPQEASINA